MKILRDSTRRGAVIGASIGKLDSARQEALKEFMAYIPPIWNKLKGHYDAFVNNGGHDDCVDFIEYGIGPDPMETNIIGVNGGPEEVENADPKDTWVDFFHMNRDGLGSIMYNIKTKGWAVDDEGERRPGNYRKFRSFQQAFKVASEMGDIRKIFPGGDEIIYKYISEVSKL